jgi:hypothetical protein
MLKDKHNKIVFVCTILMFLSKCLVDIDRSFAVISVILETSIMIIMPIIFRVKWYKPILLYIALSIFQVMSMFIKEVTTTSFINADIVAFVYMIDYYIMLVLTYLYSKLGGKFMKFGFLFLSKDKVQLEAYKNIVVKRHLAEDEKLKNKHSKELSKIDDRIAKAK